MFVDAPPTGAPAGSPVKPEPSPVIVPPETFIPALAVIIPIASILVLSRGLGDVYKRQELYYIH